MPHYRPSWQTLNDEVARLTTRVRELEMENKLLREFCINSKANIGGYFSAIIMALEKTTVALAHVITDLQTKRRDC